MSSAPCSTEVAAAIGLALDVVVTEANGPIGSASGRGSKRSTCSPCCAARSARRSTCARSPSISRPGILERIGAVEPSEGYRTARHLLDSGAAARKFDEIVAAQGALAMPGPAPHRGEVLAGIDGMLKAIDCRAINSLAKLSGAPAHPAAGLRLLVKPGDVIERGQPLFEIHARSAAHLEFARSFAAQSHSIFTIGF